MFWNVVSDQFYYLPLYTIPGKLDFYLQDCSLMPQ